jgi:hypothetical protein
MIFFQNRRLVAFKTDRQRRRRRRNISMVVECIKKNQNYWVWKTWQGFYWCGCAGTCEVGWWCHCQWRRSAFFETSFIFWINLWVVVFWSTDGFFCKSTRLKHAEGWRRNTCNDIQGKLFSVFSFYQRSTETEKCEDSVGLRVFRVWGIFACSTR